jgi:Uncharacterized alpha/beta hydrolase domain (DUF2235)
MSITTQTAPLSIASSEDELANIAAELALNTEQRDQCLKASAKDADTTDPVQSSCQIPVTIGVFFDGTNNNRKRDENETDRAHSNVVRLFNMHPSADSESPELQRPGYYSIYIAGVGTRFEENDEYKESQDGKAAAKGGQARILFAVIQVFNAIHKAFAKGQPLLKDDEVKAKLKSYAQEVEMVGNLDEGTRNERPRPTRNKWLKDFNADITKELKKARDKYLPLPYIPEVSISAFGFSRGAAEAAAFCHWLHAVIPNGQIAGMPVKFKFLGLFDCVASVGIADSARRIAPFAGVLDGHFAWASEILQPLPMVQQVVHMVAAHEQRLNFPLTRVNAANVVEIVYPGMHSDVGGGYGLKSQRPVESDAGLLSQIPLLHMHRAARAAGVPLMHPGDVPEKERDYQLSQALCLAWNGYMAALNADYVSRPSMSTAGKGSGVRNCRDFEQLLRQHMRLYYAMRRRYMGEMASWLAAYTLNLSEQDREDVVSYDERLLADYLLYSEVRTQTNGASPLDETRDVARKAVAEFRRKNPHLHPNQVLAYVLSWDRIPPWEREWMEQMAYPMLSGMSVVQGKGHEELLGRYVHDSLAGFYLAGYTTLEEKSEKLVQVLDKAEKHESLNAHEQALFDSYQEKRKTNPKLDEIIGKRRNDRQTLSTKPLGREFLPADRAMALEKFDRERVFEHPQNQLIDRADVFPKRLTDADANLLVNGISAKAIHAITDGRREGGGYLMRRAVFTAN